MSGDSNAPVTGKRGYHHGDLRSQLVVAARRLVAESGTDDFRVARAARLAGVSPSAPYRHFADREALLDAVAAEGFARLAAAMRVASDIHGPGTLAAVVAIGRTYVDFARAEPRVFRLMFGPDGRSGPAVPDASGTPPASADGTAGSEADASAPDEPAPDASEPDPYAVLVRHVALHLDKGPAATEVRRSALALWMMVHGMSSLLVDGGDAIGLGEGEVDSMLERAGRSLLEAFG